MSNDIQSKYKDVRHGLKSVGKFHEQLRQDKISKKYITEALEDM